MIRNENKQTEKMLSSLPAQVHAVLENNGYSSRIDAKEILYAGMVFERKPHAWVIIPATIISVFMINLLLGYAAGALLGPLLVILIYVLINDSFKCKFYLLITSANLLFVQKEGKTSLQIDGHRVKSMYTSFVNGETRISFTNDNLVENTIKFKVQGHSSGSWRNIEHALVMTDFSSALVNEDKLKQKYMR